MKTGKIERMLLLEQSGELTPGQRRRLEREAEKNPEVSALREELAGWKNTVMAGGRAEPDSAAVFRIAARLREERTVRIEHIWKPALALAAGLMLIAGIWNFHSRTGSLPGSGEIAAGVDIWNDPLDEKFAHLEMLVSAAAEEPLMIVEM